MPREVFGPGYRFVPREQLLTFEEIARLSRVFVGLGVTKVRLTGGEPLLRRDLPDLVHQLAGIEGIDDLALTTNGSLLATQANDLAAAGLRRVTVSLDSLDDAVFARLNDVGVTVRRVLDGIDAAEAAGLVPVKIDVVVQRGVNEGSIVPLALEGRRRGWIVRFIEYMDVGQTNGWRLEDVVPADEIVAAIDDVMPIAPIPPAYTGEVATRYAYRDGGGEIGVIASVHQTVLRHLHEEPPLGRGEPVPLPLRDACDGSPWPLRTGVDDDTLTDLIERAWTGRTDRYSEVRSEATARLPRVEMSAIGG